jgi:hypothetical protein
MSISQQSMTYTQGGHCEELSELLGLQNDIQTALAECACDSEESNLAQLLKIVN